jgi:ribonuclease PH
VVQSQSMLDLCYAEDSQAEVDLNVVMNARGRFVEVQGTAEGQPFGRETLDTLLALAEKGIVELLAAQKAVLR